MASNDLTLPDVFCVPDAGKSTDHVTALRVDGRASFGQSPPHSEPQLRELRGHLKIPIDTRDAYGVAGTPTRSSNRLQRLRSSTHPALERAPGPRLRQPAVLALLQISRSSVQLAQVGTAQSVFQVQCARSIPWPGRSLPP
ncbi:hypothetical protein ACFRIB_32570 [Streptomyces mirabilis]|uniref:hypothetical protein n=1 Tax=Streptomyces mirabilis TaxID=68239 RepID=UPI0036A23657